MISCYNRKFSYLQISSTPLREKLNMCGGLRGAAAGRAVHGGGFGRGFGGDCGRPVPEHTPSTRQGLPETAM
jgi:hypothetical protein